MSKEMENSAISKLSSKSGNTKFMRGVAQMKSFPVFIFLLPIFFVLHGYVEYQFFIPEMEALELLLFYLVIDIILLVIFYLLYKNIRKAALAAFISLSIFFFFGPLYDTLKEIADNTFLIKYSFLLSALFCIYIVSLLLVKKATLGIRLLQFLNTLFFIFIIYDLCVITFKITSEDKEPNFFVKTSNLKPDVFLLVLDGYAGQEQLFTDFSFDNSFFLNDLKELGFHILKESRSNYSDTPFSVSSLLNFEYLDLKDFSYTDQNLNYCYKRISKNAVVKVFKDYGYEFVNNSIFDIGDDASLIEKTFLLSGIDLISSQTLTSRIRRDLFNNFVMNHMRQSAVYKDFVFRDYRNNDKLYRKSLTDFRNGGNKPRFIYTHLMMPHFPYYYNAKGELNKLEDLRFDQLNRKDLYLGYLQYCNLKVLSLISEILRSSEKPIAILLLSDHGYRYELRRDLHFSNLAAIYLPNKDYSGYYDSLTNVNQFRILFKKLFNYSLPVIKDSTVQ